MLKQNMNDIGMITQRVITCVLLKRYFFLNGLLNFCYLRVSFFQLFY